MSLVNDMLRDLDARRRDTPAKGAGTEKLVPATDESGRPGSVRRQRLVMVAVIVLAAAAGVAAALYLAATRGGGGQADVPVAPVPMSPDSVISGNGVSVSSDGDQTSQQLETLAARLAELEAENRRLQQEEAAEESAMDVASDTAGNAGAQSDDGAEPPGDEPLPGDSGGDASREGDWEPRDWPSPNGEQEVEVAARAGAEAVDTAGDGASGSGNAVSAPAAGSTDEATVTRTPREPSFVERDRRQVQDALAQWSNGQRTGALEALDQFTMDNPQAHLSREMLGKLLLQRGETGIAMQVADIGLQIAPNHNGYRKLKARLLMAANRPGEAVELLDDRPPSVEGDSEYHELLATAALASGRYRAARRSYEDLLGTDDGEGRWWYGLATALEGQGEARNAVRAYERARRSGTLSSRLRQRSEERIAQLTAR